MFSSVGLPIIAGLNLSAFPSSNHWDGYLFFVGLRPGFPYTLSSLCRDEVSWTRQSTEEVPRCDSPTN
jgi:hypothetical protein